MKTKNIIIYFAFGTADTRMDKKNAYDGLEHDRSLQQAALPNFKLQPMAALDGSGNNWPSHRGQLNRLTDARFLSL